MQNNFSIHTRVASGGFVEGGLSMESHLSTWFKNTIQIGLSDKWQHDGAMYQSEIYSYAKMSELSQMKYCSRTPIVSEKVQNFMNHSKMMLFAKDMWHGETKSGKQCKNGSESCKTIKSCQLEALVLPETDALIKYLEMKQVGHANMFLGKKSLIDLKFGLFFYRWLHPDLLKRINGIYASGILEWWGSFMTEFVPKIRTKVWDDKTPKPGSLMGNILTLFIIVGYCMSFTLFFFLCEFISVVNLIRLRKTFVKYSVYIVTEFNSLLQNMLNFLKFHRTGWNKFLRKF